MAHFSPRGYKNPASAAEIADPEFWETVGLNQDARFLELRDKAAEAAQEVIDGAELDPFWKGSIGSGTSMDDVQTPGLYWTAAASENGLGMVLVAFNGGSVIQQDQFTANGRWLHRTRSSSGWTGWTRLDGGRADTIPSGTNIDTLTAPSTYVQTADVEATVARGYPADGVRGHLAVRGSSGYNWQTYVSMDAKQVWNRTKIGSRAWTPWEPSGGDVSAIQGELTTVKNDLANRIPVTRAATSTENPLDFKTLKTGFYQVTRSVDGAALGLPTADHGTLTVNKWATGAGNPGMATWITKPTPGKPSQFWSTEVANDGTAVAWTRDTAYLTALGRLPVTRAVTSPEAPLVFSELDTGRYQITRTADGAALGLPTGDHGVLEVDRWQLTSTKPGMATWTTKPTVLGDTEVWTTEIDGTGNAVGWTLATGSGRDQSSRADMGLRHAYVSTRHAATIGGPIDVGTATPVALTWDDYPGSFKAHGLAALAAQYEIPMTFAVPSRALDPGNEHLVGDGSVTWAEIDGWVQGGWVELANHSATHAANRTEADMHDEIVTALAELQAHSPTKPITTWVMPDNSWPGLDEGRDADGWASHAGQLILGHHAFATGKDSIRTDHTVPMTGVPFQGANRRWIEAKGLTDAVRQNLVASSYGTNRGVILGAHPLWIGQEDRWTLAEVETFLAWLAAERDAGRAKPMFLSEWAWARSAN